MIASQPKSLVRPCRWPRLLMIGFMVAAGPKLARAAGADSPVSVELNKLEPANKSCRVYIVVTNPSDATFPVMKLDLIFFRPDAVIERRLALDLGPVRADKKGVKTFELDGLSCENIGSVLVNDVIECRDASGPVNDCLNRISVSSRAAVQLSK